ncbi:MAG: M48 family metalloprotease [Azonexus sp.]
MRYLGSCCLLAAICLLTAACTTTPAGNRSHVVDVPLASTHADLMFSMTTGSRQSLACPDSKCAKSPESTVSPFFILQVQRVARRLQSGARSLYPDLAQRVPNLAVSGFDIYVVDSDDPSTACSANGRVAVSSVLGTWQPSDDWVAFLIAREMGHIIARHPEEDSVVSMTTSTLMNLILPGSMLVKSAFSAGGGQLASFSQRDIHEEEADAIALSLLRAAGYRSQNLALALRKKPAVLDDSRWSRSFRRSSDYALAKARGKKMTVATAARRRDF